MKDLLKQLSEKRKEIKTDSLSMSIGELVNLYKEGDLDLNPAFQRLFRWEDDQKTKFVESILLGIPIPEIFVAQQADGKWTVVDGVQRISTVLQLTGELQDYKPLKMTYAEYLPDLEEQTWETLPEQITRVFRRSKLGISIILTENSISAQYELFQRLNTGGLQLEDQEIRNCLIIMLNEDYYKKIDELKNFEPFLNSINITERQIKEEYHMELILRFFIATSNIVNFKAYPAGVHLREFIDKETIRLIESDSFDLERSIKHFESVFELIYSLAGKNAFKKYNEDKDKFEGGFSNAVFEVLTTGISENIDKLKDLDVEAFNRLKIEIINSTNYQENVAYGTRSYARFQALTKFSKDYFAKVKV